MTSRPISPPPPSPLEIDDLLFEILLCLPPLPSSLPRASVVSKRWYRLAADPEFLRRFRRRHHGEAPTLGLFSERFLSAPAFVPLLDPPDRVPAGRLSPRLDDGCETFRVLDCRHGLLLLCEPWLRQQVMVCDPVTGYQRRLEIPPDLERTEAFLYNGAVICAAGDGAGDRRSIPFQVALVATEKAGHPRASACVFSSETGAWGGTVSTSLHLKDYVNTGSVKVRHYPLLTPGMIYWLYIGQWRGCILEHDFHAQSLSAIDLPLHEDGYRDCTVAITPAENSGGLGFAVLSFFHVQLWSTKAAGSDGGAAVWVPGKVILLNSLLSLRLPAMETIPIIVAGLSEDNSVIYVLTADSSVYMVNIHSSKFTKLSPRAAMDIRTHFPIYPFASLYPAGRGIGGPDGGAQM